MVLYRAKHDGEHSTLPPHSGWLHDPLLQREAILVAPAIRRLKAAHDGGALPAVTFTAGYLVAFAMARHGSVLCGRRQKPIVLAPPTTAAPRVEPLGNELLDMATARVVGLHPDDARDGAENRSGTSSGLALEAGPKPTQKSIFRPVFRPVFSAYFRRTLFFADRVLGAVSAPRAVAGRTSARRPRPSC